MTLRTKSRTAQWGLWTGAALALLAAYVVLSRFLNGSVGWSLFDPRQYRLAVPLLALFVYVAKETRWDGVKREEKKSKGEGQRRDSPTCAAEPLASSGGERPPDAPQSHDTADSLGEEGGAAEARALPQRGENGDPDSSSTANPSGPSPTGEELYVQARTMPHLPIPDFDHDSHYLKLLGQSAAAGFARASMKLGQYAMRRGAWVEAYYWMSQAQRQGMEGLGAVRRDIRRNWSREGFPNQTSNYNDIFTVDAGSIGRALLHVDSGHEAAKARQYLKTHYPELL